jgi:hypothetical protein
LEDGAIVIEHLEAEILSDHGDDHIHGAYMPPPSTRRFPYAAVFLLSSQHLVLHGGHEAIFLLLFFIDHGKRN